MAVGVATALIMTFVWGSLRDVPVIHDGAAYLTQARTFASLHLYGAARPFPEFFAQYHMLVTPRFVSKYPPGHSLALVPGVWLGLPALVPVVLAGVAGALLFALARGMANAWVGLAAWEWWVTAPDILRFEATYLSQTTTVALWLLAWWALRRWWLTERRSWLLLLGLCAGFGQLTHPYSWLLFSIPTGVVVLSLVIRRRAWTDLAVCSLALAGAVVLHMGWNLATVGSATTTPWQVYAQQYLPADRLGFGSVAALPARPLPPDMAAFAQSVAVSHARHTVHALPGEVPPRVRGIVRGAFGGWQLVLAPVALLSLVALSSEFVVALCTAATVLLGYLLYATTPTWTAYYLELTPVWAFALAIGFWVLAGRVTARKGGSSAERVGIGAIGRRAAFAMLIICAALVPLYGYSIWTGRKFHAASGAENRVFDREVARRFRTPSMVFIRYAPGHDVNRSLIVNPADLEHARVWLVRDRGGDDLRLIRFAPSRAPFLYDEASHSFSRIDTAALVAQDGS